MPLTIREIINPDHPAENLHFILSAETAVFCLSDDASGKFRFALQNFDDESLAVNLSPADVFRLAAALLPFCEKLP